MTTIRFTDIHAPAPDMDRVQAQYDTWLNTISESPDQTLACLREWDDLRRSLSSWQSMVDLHFNQDTTNPKFQDLQSTAIN